MHGQPTIKITQGITAFGQTRKHHTVHTEWWKTGG